MEIMHLDVYITFAITNAVICMVVGMYLANKNNELEGGVIVVIPSIAVVVGLLWPLAYIVGGFLSCCYILSVIIKKVS